MNQAETNQLQSATERVLNALGEIKAEVAGVRTDVKHIVAAQEDHEDRIRRIERKAQYAAGAAGLVTILISIAAWAL